MGMYTELRLCARLKKDCDKNVVDLIGYMISGKCDGVATPEHELFSTSRWKIMLCSESYYFDAKTNSTLEYDDIPKQFFLNIQCNLKNYNNEIEKFVSWIKPYLDKEPGEFLGYSRYEETEIPTLLYM